MADLSETTKQTALAIDESRRAIEELNQAADGLETEATSMRVSG